VKIITLTTDFGLRDGYPGVMKGVFLRIPPDTHIIDISHFVRPQNILEGSLILNRTYPFFPDGTVHILVIDPGVGTSRRPIAAHLGNQYYVCPDNGLLTGPLVEAEKEGQFIEIVHLNQPKYWLREVSHVFHGRDVFAPVAAHIAAGVPLQEMGSPISDPVRLFAPQPTPIANGWRGQITNNDHFGNMSTNFTTYHLASLQNPQLRISGRHIDGVVRTFGDRLPNDLIAFEDSDGFIAIAVVNGNAAAFLGSEIGDLVEMVEGC